jgi:hypothetical protein
MLYTGVMGERHVREASTKSQKDETMSIVTVMILLLAAAIGIWAAIALVSALIRVGGFRALFRAWRSALGDDEKKNRKF